jgi:LPXTG-motif cell wall-anchored protein
LAIGPDGPGRRAGGANTNGAYDSTANGSPSLNGGGNGFATGKPAAGSVGNADDKNPPGQHPWGKPGADKNKGYECDANKGIGKGNPAHSACVTPTPPVTVPETPTTVPAKVLGEQFTRTLPAASVAGSQGRLPRTGFPVAGTALVGLGLVAAGGVVWWMARRRHEGQHLAS